MQYLKAQFLTVTFLKFTLGEGLKLSKILSVRILKNRLTEIKIEFFHIRRITQLRKENNRP